MFNINTDLVFFFFMFRLINIVFTKSVNYNNLSDLFNLRQKYIMKKPEHYVHAFQIERSYSVKLTCFAWTNIFVLNKHL